jgi:DNA-directed RNA polymerase subunit beta
VKRRERVTKGQVLEGYGTNQGELALGRNTQVHLCRGRATTEDAIVISERGFVTTSLPIHIEEFELKCARPSAAKKS